MGPSSKEPEPHPKFTTRDRLGDVLLAVAILALVVGAGLMVYAIVVGVETPH